MTRDKQFKAEVRRYAEANGLAYADARRRLLAEREADADKTAERFERFDSDEEFLESFKAGAQESE